MITSIQNENVKKWRKLHKRKERELSGTFIIEGHHLIEEACKSDWEIVSIIAQEKVSIPSLFENYPITVVSEHVFKHITQTMSPQGIAAVVKMKSMIPDLGNHVLLIDAVQDPGNLGTIIRTADAAGFDAVIIGDNSVDVFNEKVIRATQGSLFHIAIYPADLSKEISNLKNKGFTIWATALTNAKKYNDIPVGEKTAIIVGNEGAGVQTELIDLADEIVTIPIYGKAESLNVSIAAGILMYYVKG